MVTKWKERRVEETKKNERQKWTAGLTEGKWRAEDGGWDGGARERRGSGGQTRKRRAERERKWEIWDGIIARVHPWCMKCLLITFHPPFCHLWPS